MPALVRSTLLALVCTLVACQHASHSIDAPVEGSVPIAEVEGGGAELAIVAVEQSLPFDIETWRFEPGGRRMASTELGDCSVWDVESGWLIRSFELGDPPPPACADWPASVSVHEFTRDTSSADGRLELALGKRVAIVEVASGKQLRELDCPTCASADAITWSASGHQLALVWAEARRVETWDAETGKRLRTETIAAAGELDEFVLGWTAFGPMLALSEWGESTECGFDYGDCELTEDGEPVAYPVRLRRVIVVTDAGVVEKNFSANTTLGDLGFDSEGRWVFERYALESRRTSLEEIDVYGLDGRASGLTGQHEEDYFGGDDQVRGQGEWRNDGATYWSVLVEYRDEFEGGLSGVYWETTQTSPPRGRSGGQIAGQMQDWGTAVDIALYGVVDRTTLHAGEACGEESCETFGPTLPPDCTLLDIGSNHGAELLDCGGRVHLRSQAKLLPLPLDANTAFWWWCRGGALVIDDGGTFLVIDAASGRIGLQRNDVADVLDGKLGTEIDRLILVGDWGLELLDLTSLQVPLRLADESPVALAFSPSGDRLALLDRDRIRVLELPSGKPLASWSIGEREDLAFRQDGAVIYVGAGFPEAGFDAASGEPLNDPLLFAKIAEASDASGEPDPSWRWVMIDEFGELMRTSDGRTIEWFGEGAWLPDTGQYVGSPPGAELAFRVGSDPWAVPEFDAEQLAPWLMREDLVEAFLTGQAIPKPNITAAELAGLRAKPKGKRE